MYIDESGDHTYNNLETPERRYLCLVGCIFDLQVYRQEFQASLEALKDEYFTSDPDEPVILHRSDLINKRGVFRVLLDTNLEKKFNEDLLQLVQKAKFTLIAVVIDKKAHIERYGDAAWHPYHYCLTALLERYCGFLNFFNRIGDVMVESRGKAEDFQLKEAYGHIYKSGTYWRSASWFQKVLSSHEIKLKPKRKNVAGLQLADLVAHPVKLEILFEKQRTQDQKMGFGQRLCKALAGKYNFRPYSGDVWGYGKIFLD